MSHPIIKTACVVAGFAVAALAATSAHAGKLSVKQKNEMAAAMARNYQAKEQKTALRTPAKAALLAPNSGIGKMSAELPPELDIYLTASPDANGNMHVRDTDASGSSTVTAVEKSDEI